MTVLDSIWDLQATDYTVAAFLGKLTVRILDEDVTEWNTLMWYAAGKTLASRILKVMAFSRYNGCDLRLLDSVVW